MFIFALAFVFAVFEGMYIITIDRKTKYFILCKQLFYGAWCFWIVQVDGCKS